MIKKVINNNYYKKGYQEEDILNNITDLRVKIITQNKSKLYTHTR